MGSAIAIDKFDAGRAIENGEFVPHFQPLADLRNLPSITGLRASGGQEPSAAGRWIPPDEFIPSPSKMDGFTQLLAELLRKGLSAVAALPGAPMLSVNLSTLQLRDLSCRGKDQARAEKAGFSLDCLIVEITESAQTKTQFLPTIVHALKEMGCKLALDDFGTGYSSLLYRQSMPLTS